MRATNILSIVNVVDDLTEDIALLYMNNYGVSLKEDELNDLKSLVNEIQKKDHQAKIFDGYFIGYSICQIGKEFDLLRFGNDCVVNIELKRTASVEKIRDQLIRNSYYLSFMDKEIHNFTYVSDKNKFYYLDSASQVAECDVDHLIAILLNQNLTSVQNIDNLFEPSNYLVSPFNSTEAFIEGKYFLTSQQEQIKRYLVSLNVNNNEKFISIYGSAGTGKTLLTYDIAKEYLNNGYKVLIFHCGNLNTGQLILKRHHSWPIFSIKSIDHYLNNNLLSDYDLIIFDEVQRMYSTQLISAVEQIKSSQTKCLFSYDSNQCLSKWEINRNIPEIIEKEVSPKKYKLTEKIRTNKEIASFIKKLFNLKNRIDNQKFMNVEITYFSEYEAARNFMNVCRDNGWKFINYTASSYKSEPFDNYQMIHEENAHYVIGQEFDKVGVVIDNNFYHDDDGILSYSRNTYYHATKMLFQIVTRTRKKLHLIIVNNEYMLKKCIEIIEN